MFTSFVALPLILLHLLQTYSQYQQFIHQGVAIEAQILDTSNPCPDSACEHYVTYQYNVNSKTYTRNSEKLESTAFYETNGKAKVYYLPKHPEQSLLIDNFTYERSLNRRIMGISMGWALLVAVVWLPHKNFDSRRAQLLRYLRYSAVYAIIIGLTFGWWITDMEQQPMPLYLPILLIAGAMFLNFYYEKSYDGLDYPLFVLMFTMGCVMVSVYWGETASFAYTVAATLGGLLMHDSRQTVGEDLTISRPVEN